LREKYSRFFVIITKSAILVFLKKSSDQEHKKQQEDKIREMEDRFNSNKHDRSVLEQLIKELDQIKVI